LPTLPPNFIAGFWTCDDWRRLKLRLTVSGPGSAWDEAFREFLLQRLELRYLNPIRLLQDHGTFQGEGFSIMAIQCSLIEFLESTMTGVNYRHLASGGRLGPYEYSSSSRLFVNFLTLREPFSQCFDEPLARSFYSGVRCGLLHEATTKDGWRIWANDEMGRIIEPERKIVYRDHFQAALLQLIDNYGKAISSDQALQQAFIRRFDGVCTASS
jgi:hypothetical protein